MSHARRHPKNFQRQVVNPSAVPSISGVLGGVQSITVAPSVPSAIAFDPSVTGNNDIPPPFTPTTPLPPSSSSSNSSTPSSSPTGSNVSANSSSAAKSQLPIGTVIAACVGAFFGAIILISIFLWWVKRPSKSRARAVNTRARQEQRQDRGRSWNRLGEDEDRWEGGAGAGGDKVEMSQTHKDSDEMGQTQKDADEKNFPMFKKTYSMRTTRTDRALEEHGIDLPPFEFSQYHPNLAEELSLEQPDKPFAPRQNSGSSSWDRSSNGDDSFLSLRSVRVDSGTMSPTFAYKMTPPASNAAVHKWETAEVVTMSDDASQPGSNPFADVHEERSGSNPFFGAQDMHRTASRRSRSNSRSSRHSRNTSRTSRTSRPSSRVRPDSETNPFGDGAMPAGIPPFKPQHLPSDSLASSSSGSAFATEQAMKNLIAALNLTQEEVQERLRVASMQASTISRYSGISNIRDDESDVATITAFQPPPSPLSPNATHAR